MPFLPLFTGIRHLAHVLTVPPTKVRLLCATPAGLDLYIYTGHACRHLPSAVPWISEDRLLKTINYSSKLDSCIKTYHGQHRRQREGQEILEWDEVIGSLTSATIEVNFDSLILTRLL